MKSFKIILTALFSILLGNIISSWLEIPTATLIITPLLFFLANAPLPAGSFYTYIPVDVLKKDTPTPAYTPIKHILTIFRHRDVLTHPSRDSKGVKISSNVIMSTNKNMIKLQVTAGTVAFEGTGEGDPDAKAIIQKLSGNAPGYELELAEFIQNNLNEDLGAILEFADGSTPLYFGDEAAPLQLVVTSSGNKDKISAQVSLESSQKGPVIGHYFGTMTYAEDFEIAADDATPSVAEGSGRYVVPDDNASPVTITGFDDAVKGMIITLVGSGGDNLSTIATSSSFILEGGTSWTSVAGSTITFEVFSATVFIERSRT